jgi:hypothetical protein
MSTKRKENKGNPAKPAQRIEELQDQLAGTVAQFITFRQRIGLGAVAVGDIRVNIDPDGLVLRQFLESLQAASNEPGGGGMLALQHALTQAGIHDAQGLWRAVEAVSSAAATGALVWAEDFEGTGPVNLQTVVETAAAYRPQSLNAYNERQEERQRELAARQAASE